MDPEEITHPTVSGVDTAMASIQRHRRHPVNEPEDVRLGGRRGRRRRRRREQ